MNQAKLSSEEPSVGDLVEQITDEMSKPSAGPSEERRPCTCHPDDNPPVPCAGKYALSECRAAASKPSAGECSAQEHIERYFPKGYDPEAEPWKGIKAFHNAALRAKDEQIEWYKRDTQRAATCADEMAAKLAAASTDTERLREALQWYATARYPDDGSGRPPEAFQRRAKEALRAEGIKLARKSAGKRGKARRTADRDVTRR